MSDARDNRVTKKRGRPKGSLGPVPAMTVLTMRVSPDDIEQIDEWCKRYGVTRSEALRTWVIMGLGWRPSRGWIAAHKKP